MSTFRDLADEFAKANAQVLGVSIDSFAAAEAFRADLGCTFPILGDWPLNRTGQAFGVHDPERHLHRRVTFVLDQQHTIRAVIDDPRDMERHANEALEEVKKLVP